MPLIRGTELAPGAYWPLLRVTIRLRDGQRTRTLAMLDSGADNSIVPYELIEPSGIKWEDLTPIEPGHGAGGQLSGGDATAL